MRKSDLAVRVGWGISATLSTLFLGIAVTLLTDIIDNQRSLMQRDAVQIEHQGLIEEQSNKVHKAQENEIKAIKTQARGLDRRVTILETKAN